MQPIKTCLVEDSKDIRDGMISLLALDDRFEVLGAYPNAESAITPLIEEQPDIVIMDINLPGMNGIDCIRRVQAHCKDTQFIMYTIYEDDEKVFEALAAGASGYLLKKTPLSKITDSLVELHAGGAPMSTSIARKVIERFRSKQASDHTAVLSAREKEVLEYLAKGLLYKEIAVRLSISTGTVRQHIHNIYEKLHVQNRTEAINKAYGSNNQGQAL